MPTSPPLSIVQSIPHGGLDAPNELRDLLSLDETAIYNECDLWVDLIYDLAHPELGAEARPTLASVTTPIARAIVDVNRPPFDLADPDGPIKGQTSYGLPTWRRPLLASEKQLLLERHWAPWHARLNDAMRMHQREVRLFLDCHSMAQRGPTTYDFAGEPRPLICLANLGGEDGEPRAGGEPVTCSGAFLRHAAALAEKHFGDLTLLEPDGPPPPVVTLNWPFAGGYLLRESSGAAVAGGANVVAALSGHGETAPDLPNARIKAPQGIMIEINRGLYVGNQHALTPPAPPSVPRIAELRRRLARWATELCRELTPLPDAGR